MALLVLLSGWWWIVLQTIAVESGRPILAAQLAVATHVLILLGALIGGRLEQRHGLLTRSDQAVRGWMRRQRQCGAPAATPTWPPAQSPDDHGPGDPALVNAVLRLRPAHPRLTASKPADAIRAWQALARPALRHHCVRTDLTTRTIPRLARFASVAIDQHLCRTQVSVTAGDGTPVPGYLFEPTTPSSGRSAVLVIPGHGTGIDSTAGLVPSYENRCALELARAGHIVLTLELRGSGHLAEAVGACHEAIATNALLLGSSYQGVVMDDLSAGLEALRRLPGVDPERIAVTGASLGGNLAISLTAMHPWVRAVVAQGLVDWLDLDGRHSAVRAGDLNMLRDPCWIRPRVNSSYWSEDPFLLIAPRPMLLVNSYDDVGDMLGRGNWMIDRLRAVYARFDASNDFAFLVAPGAHQYYVEPATRFLATHL